MSDGLTKSCAWYPRVPELTVPGDCCPACGRLLVPVVDQRNELVGYVGHDTKES